MPYSPNLYDMGGTRFVASEFCNCLMSQDAEAEVVLVEIKNTLSLQF